MTKKRQKPWESVMSKAREGYSNVTYEDTRSLDSILAGIIAKHLRAFLKSVKACGSCPGSLTSKYGERGFEEWLNILRKMIYAFEEYNRKPEIRYDYEEEERGEIAQQQWKAKEEERQMRIREGMQLFIDYYSDLWW